MFLIITKAELISWVRTSKLPKLGSSLKNTTPGKAAVFEEMMLSVPGEAYLDEGAYILVELNKDLADLCPAALDPENESKLIWIDLAAVAAFYPLSERGAELLGEDAKRLGVRLGQPQYKEPFSLWQAKTIEAAMNYKGHKFLHVLLGDVAERYTQSVIPAALFSILRFDNELPDTGPLGQFIGGRFTPWARGWGALRVTSDSWLRDMDLVRDQLLHFGEMLRNDIRYEAPIVAGTSQEDMLKAFVGKRQAIFFMTVIVMYYVELLQAGTEVYAESLKRDLSLLVRGTDMTLALEGAYLIGRQVSDERLANMCYSAKPALYPVLTSPKPWPSNSCDRLI
jgi:hypothetical protein